MILDPTPIPGNSYLVRLLDAEGGAYSRMIVVTDEGDTLFLMGWIGKPMSLEEWREARDKLFPNAKFVRFERRRKNGDTTITLPIG